MKLVMPSDYGVTIVENRFIDRYMPKANGEFVKVYLYLLRCAHSGQQLCVSAVADVFEHTDKDVLRALKYWEKAGLLHMTCTQDGTPETLTFVMPGEEAAQPEPKTPETDMAQKAVPEHTASVTGEAAQPTAAVSEIPHHISPSAARKKELREQTDFAQLIFVGESYLGRPMKSQEINNLIYFYDDLHFSADLIEYLLEYCAEKGNPGPNYMEKVAQSWYREGITTPAQAKAASRVYRQEYYTIFRYLGITSHRPADPEMALMDKWLQEYGFSLDVIKEACRRTVLSAGKPDFRYIDSILSGWHKSGVKTVTDIPAPEPRRRSAAQQSAADKDGKHTRAARSRSTQSNRFNSFEQQRGYDWDDLTARLLHTSEGK